MTPTPPRVCATFDAAMKAHVVRRQPLFYDAGADPGEDRPAHVRAASAMAWLGGRLAVVQDDASFVAIVEPGKARVSHVTLPHAPGGARQFDDLRGNKRDKLDFEACLVLEERLVAFGSGSTPVRERVLVMDAARRPRLVPASPLYAALRTATEFSGSELNVEGAAQLGAAVVLFQRGNGAPRGPLSPIDATGELDARALAAWLDAPGASGPPPLRGVATYDLGAIAGARLSFTDACSLHPPAQALAYLAAAEASPDATRDGPVSGVALGLVSPGRWARYAVVLDEHGVPLADKLEGLAQDPASPERFFAVSDRDEPHAPAELFELRVQLPR